MQANFRSDNESPVADPIMDALAEANLGTAHAYAEDDWTARLDQQFSSLFGIETTVIPVSKGVADRDQHQLQVAAAFARI